MILLVDHVKPLSNTWKLKRYDSFDDFVDRWLTKKNINKHYFFWSQSKYLLDQNENLNIDFIGKFENLECDFKKLCKIMRISKNLPKLNVSKVKKDKIKINNSSLEKIKYIYSQDYKLFDY